MISPCPTPRTRRAIPRACPCCSSPRCGRPQWLLLVYLLHTVGELCLSPIGLSMVTKLAPARLAAVMMGIWFTASAIANYLAGILESLLAGSGIPLYWFLVGSSAGAGALLLLITPLLQRLMRA